LLNEHTQTNCFSRQSKHLLGNWALRIIDVLLAHVNLKVALEVASVDFFVILSQNLSRLDMSWTVLLHLRHEGRIFISSEAATNSLLVCSQGR